jgi:hypothetical protein
MRNSVTVPLEPRYMYISKHFLLGVVLSRQELSHLVVRPSTVVKHSQLGNPQMSVTSSRPSEAKYHFWRLLLTARDATDCLSYWLALHLLRFSGAL